MRGSNNSRQICHSRVYPWSDLISSCSLVPLP
jgi:hypothetical protein